MKHVIALVAVILLTLSIGYVSSTNAQESEHSGGGGGGGGVSTAGGSGTANVIPRFVSASSIADSKITMSGTNLGTATLYDSTAVTGVTSLVVRAGANQGTTKAIETRTSADAVLVSLSGTAARIEFSGDIGFTRWNSGLIAPITSGGSFAGLFVEQILGTDGAQQRFNLKANGTNPFLRFGSGGSVLWTDHVAENSGTDDTALVRAIPGIIRATNASTGDGGFQGVSLQGASSKDLSAATPTGFVDIPVDSDARIGGVIEYCVEADDGTDFQIESGVIQFAAVNKAGTVTTASPTATGTPLQVLNSGTLTAAFTATAGSGKITINCDAASSLTETTLRIRFRVHVNSSTTAIAVAPL